MNRISTAYAFVLAGALVLAPSAVLAHGGGNGGGHSETHDSTGTGNSGNDTGPDGGMSAGHMSEDGMENTNGPNATDRDTGADRTEDRTGTNTDVDDDGQGGDEQSHPAVPGTDTDETGG
jgi:hypothetical protein